MQDLLCKRVKQIIRETRLWKLLFIYAENNLKFRDLMLRFIATSYLCLNINHSTTEKTEPIEPAARAFRDSLHC